MTAPGGRGSRPSARRSAPEATPRRYIAWAACEHTLGILRTHLADAGGLVALIGPAGVGKSVLMRALAERFEGSHPCVLIDRGGMSRHELYGWVASELEAREAVVPQPGEEPAKLLRPARWMNALRTGPSADPEKMLIDRARRAARRGARLVILVDEAQDMDEETAQGLLELARSQRDGLSIGLALMDCDAARSLENQLGPAAVWVRHDASLSYEEMVAYVRECLYAADVTDGARAAVHERMLRRMHAYTAGIPRRVHGEIALLLRSHCPPGQGSGGAAPLAIGVEEPAPRERRVEPRLEEEGDLALLEARAALEAALAAARAQGIREAGEAIAHAEAAREAAIAAVREEVARDAARARAALEADRDAQIEALRVEAARKARIADGEAQAELESKLEDCRASANRRVAVAAREAQAMREAALAEVRAGAARDAARATLELEAHLAELVSAARAGVASEAAQRAEQAQAALDAALQDVRAQAAHEADLAAGGAREACVAAVARAREEAQREAEQAARDARQTLEAAVAAARLEAEQRAGQAAADAREEQQRVEQQAREEVDRVFREERESGERALREARSAARKEVQEATARALQEREQRVRGVREEQIAKQQAALQAIEVECDAELAGIREQGVRRLEEVRAQAREKRSGVIAALQAQSERTLAEAQERSRQELEAELAQAREAAARQLESALRSCRQAREQAMISAVRRAERLGSLIVTGLRLRRAVLVAAALIGLCGVSFVLGGLTLGAPWLSFAERGRAAVDPGAAHAAAAADPAAQSERSPGFGAVATGQIRPADPARTSDARE